MHYLKSSGQGLNNRGSHSERSSLTSCLRNSVSAVTHWTEYVIDWIKGGILCHQKTLKKINVHFTPDDKKDFPECLLALVMKQSHIVDCFEYAWARLQKVANFDHNSANRNHSGHWACSVPIQHMTPDSSSLLWVTPSLLWSRICGSLWELAPLS